MNFHEGRTGGGEENRVEKVGSKGSFEGTTRFSRPFTKVSQFPDRVPRKSDRAGRQADCKRA